VAEVLDEVSEHRNKPDLILLDNGPEFISKALDLWAYQAGVKLDYSRSENPPDHAYVGSSKGSFFTECVNANPFLSLEEARSRIEPWHVIYNELGPHSSLEGRPLNPMDWIEDWLPGRSRKA